MEKDLKQVAEKYKSLSDAEQIDLEMQTHGQVVSEWGLDRLEELNSLRECSWFHLEKLGVKVGGDGRLRLAEGVISEISEEETRQNLKSASDLIGDYLSVLIEFLENPKRMGIDLPDEKDPDEWGTEELLLGLLERRRGEDFEIFG